MSGKGLNLPQIMCRVTAEDGLLAIFLVPKNRKQELAPTQDSFSYGIRLS